MNTYPNHSMGLATAVALLALSAAPSALACSSCGCTLNSDWASQGFKSGPGLSLDLRHDYFNQNDLRSGSGRVDRGAIAYPNEAEIQQQTVNRNTTLGLDYAFSADWGLSLSLPWLSRYHTTIAEGDTELSTSQSNSLGDVRLLGRYQGFSAGHDWGLQFGLKLPTGASGVRFKAGPQDGEALDRGLQPGTGSTDLLLGVYSFGPLQHELDYFAQALAQIPVGAGAQFRPGAGLNLSAGLRYLGGGPLVPQLQINVRTERKESGSEADIPNSGATLVYLSPGATWTVGDKMQIYGFVQLPIYQHVSGIQIEPRSSLSLGLHYAY